MALNFPASPTDGQTYVAPNGVTYVYDATDTLWRAQAGDGENVVFVSATAPVSPVNGKMWWNTDTGTMFIWYNDGNSGQWVPATTPGPAGILPGQDLEVSSLVSSGDVQTTSLNGGQLGGRRSLIINGGMEVAQRGVGPTDATNAYATVDRMQNANGGGLKSDSTSQQGGMGINEAPSADGHRNYFRINNESTTVAVNTYRNFRYVVEAIDIAQCGWNPTDPESKMTISFWARSSVTFTPKLWLNLAQSGEITFAPTSKGYSVDVPLVANTWTKVEHTFSGQSDNSLISNTIGVGGLVINLGLYWGTNYTDASDSLPEGSWYTWNVDERVNTMGTEWVSQLNATFDITGLQLELGDIATPYEHRRYSDQLRDCQRYYYKEDSVGIRLYTAEHTNTNRYLRFPRPVPMASAPTETGSAGVTVIFFGDPNVLQIQASGVANTSGATVMNYTAEAEL